MLIYNLPAPLVSAPISSLFASGTSCSIISGSPCFCRYRNAKYAESDPAASNSVDCFNFLLHVGLIRFTRKELVTSFSGASFSTVVVVRIGSLSFSSAAEVSPSPITTVAFRRDRVLGPGVEAFFLAFLLLLS